MEGYQVSALDDVVGEADIFVSATGNDGIITSEHMAAMKHNAIVCNIGHPSFVMSCSFSNQVIAQMELFGNTENYPLGVYVLPKRLDEKVARLHLDALGVKLTKLTDEQAEYLGVDPSGPFKADHYRY